MKSVARAIRAATARSIAGRASEPRLIAIFAEDRLEVAAPCWPPRHLMRPAGRLVLSSASAEVADFIRTIRGDVRRASAGAGRGGAPPAAENSRRRGSTVDRRYGRANRTAEEQAREQPAADEREFAPDCQAGAGHRARPVPLGMRCVGADRLGRRRAARRADRPQPAGRGRRTARTGARFHRPVAV